MRTAPLLLWLAACTGDPQTPKSDPPLPTGDPHSAVGAHTASPPPHTAAPGPTGDTAAELCLDDTFDAPFVVTGSTVGADDDHPECGGRGSGDLSYGFVAPTDGVYRAHLDGQGQVSVLDDCAAPQEVTCGGDLELDLVSGQAVVFVVDGGGGPFTLTVAPPTEVGCDDDDDGDLDGAVDCLDVDCGADSRTGTWTA